MVLTVELSLARYKVQVILSHIETTIVDFFLVILPVSTFDFIRRVMIIQFMNFIVL